MATRGGVWRRHRARVAANLALLVALGGVVFYAAHTDGYRTHRAELNDGGIWTTNPRLGYFGRVNKQIGQYDGAVFADSGSALDIVQEDSAVVGVDLTTGRISPIDPARVAEPDGQQASIPAAGQVQLAGGTLAVLDERDGALRAARVDPESGTPAVSALDTSARTLALAGPRAALAVTQAGTVFAISADEDTLTRVDPVGDGFGPARRFPLAVPLGDGADLTTVGQTPVTLDPGAGSLAAVGGARAVVEADAVLQQPGPDAASVLVATPSAVVDVDLTTGVLTTVADGLAGRPAEPVRLGDCVFGAWSGAPATVVSRCGAEEPRVALLRGPADDLVFRVNRGEILLNDRQSGAVWRLDTAVPTRLEDWEAYTQRDDQDRNDPDKERSNQGDRRPPKAKPDRFGARPGRTTVLHPLDNDSAPPGRVLAIRSVVAVSDPAADLTVSPDGQTVQLRLPDSATGQTTFQYVVDDGRPTMSARTSVTVTARPSGQNAPPALRPGFEPRVWPVPADGSISLPVLADWRDRQDGDTLALEAATTDDSAGAAVRVTTDGRIRFTAPPEPGPVSVSYSVTDGRSAAVSRELAFRVQDPATDRAVPAVAEPDVVAAEVGTWVTIRPLANDLPGADPLSPQAQLELAGHLAAVPGTQVRTDLGEGTVAFRAQVARSYALHYDVAYGDSPLARGQIRVDVSPRTPKDPVAMPDTAALFGPSATTVDVLANDVDPEGGLLVVQGAYALSPDQVEVAVVDGRWLRVGAREGRLATTPQVVRYTISNGGRAVTGEVSVTQRPVPRDNSPVTEPDQVVVRAGAAVSVPVLDNDFSPSGDALALVPDVVGERAGELTVRAAGPARGQRGEAFVSGRLVRYVAPADLAAPETFEITYVAANTRGDSAPGRLEVTVVPASRPNRAPEPPLLEGRVTSGGTVTVKLPGAGVDPDGDPVTLLGLASPPRLGRVVKIGATSIEYQAFPASSGTDTFEYLLADAQGARATGTARVAVAPPASPPRPLALPDTLTVEPGRTATVDPLANDVIAAGDRVVVELVQPPAGVRLASPTGPVTVATPGGAPGRTVEVVYRLSNGLESSQATVTVRTAAPYNNPPVVFDAFGRDTPAPTVRMDVLSAAYDPDGPSSGLRVTDVTAPPGTPVSVSRGRITVTKAAQPTVLAFRVEDADGGAAMAQLFVPGRVAALPTVKPDARISLAPGESLRARLSDYVDNPAGSAVRFTAADAVTGSPAAGVEAQVTGSATFSVRATPGYTGPGAVSFVVTDKGANTPGAQRVVLTVPVQVGSSAPVLRCPTDPVTVPQGGSIALDVGVMCNVYTPDPADRFGLSYSAEWAGPVAGLTLATRTGNPLVVSADPSARVGREGLLLVRAGRSEPDRLRVRVGGAGAPALSPIQISDLKAGETRRVDLASHFTAGVATPRPTVVQVARLAGTGVEVTPVGGSTVLVRADARASGHAEFRIVMSDAGPTAQRARLASNVLSLDLLSVPETPRPPVPGAGVRNGEVHLTWAAPRANGASIDSYEVRVSDGSSRRCATTSCDITGLTNGRSYRFSVRAHNAVGWSDPSAPSRSAQPDAVPGPVGQIRLTKQGDGALTIAWSPPQTVTSHVHKYLVTWRGGGRGFSTGPSFIATGLDNDKTYRFTVYAINDKGMGEGRTSSPFQSAGRPGRPAAPTIADTPSGSGDTATLTVTWPEVEANGPYPVLYTLSRNGVGVPQCQGVPTTSCTIEGVPYDGRTYSFAVGAYAGRNYSQGPAKGWQAVARPAEWGRWTVDATGVDGQARADFVVPSSRGRRSDVSIWVDGVQRFFRSDLSGAVSRTFSVGDNDGPHTVWLRVCNEKGESDGGCTDSSRLQVQTYGPLETYHILAIRSVVDGTRLRWEVDVDTNGAPASVLLESSARPDLRFTLTGVDRQTVRTEFLDLGYSAREEVRITLFDDSERDRGPVLKRAVDTTPDPPDPVVQVRRGSLCSDDPASPLPRCHPPGAGPDCVDPSCGFVELVPAHFLSPVTCDLTVQGGAGDVTTVGPIPDDAPFETSFYVGSPGDWVRAECHDASGTRSDDDRYTWPG